MQNHNTTTGAGNLSAVRLTELETKALRVLFEDAEGNGFDFGMTNSIYESGVMQPEQIRGVVSSLVKKGIITVWGNMGQSAFVQFDWGKVCKLGPNNWKAMPQNFDEFCAMFGLVPA